MGFNPKSAATTLDSVFLARSTTKRANVGYQENGSDISNKYEKYTSGTKSAATGFNDGGTDLSNLFQNYNVPLVSYQLSNENVTSFGTQLDGDPSPQRAGYRVASDGYVRVASTSGNGFMFSAVNTGTDWIIPHSSPGSGKFYVRATATGSSLSDGTLNTYLDVYTNPWWAVESTGIAKSTTLTVSLFEYDGSYNLIDSATIILSATYAQE